MLLFKLWCHLYHLHFINVVKLNNVLPTDCFFTHPQICFFQIVSDILKQMWRVIEYKYLFVAMHNVWFFSGNILQLLNETSIVRALVTYQCYYIQPSLINFIYTLFSE